MVQEDLKRDFEQTLRVLHDKDAALKNCELELEKNKLSSKSQEEKCRK
jgi:hypothetical protein